MPARRLTLTSGVREADVLASVLVYLRYSPRVAWVERMNSGAGRLARKGRDGQMVMSQYLRCGWVGAPDIFAQMWNGRVLAIECKSDIGRVRPEQAAFLDQVRAANGVSGIVRSIDEARRLVCG